MLPACRPLHYRPQCKKRDKLRDFEVVQTIGLFYNLKEYEPEYYWWDSDVAFLSRRFLLCLCAIVFHGRPYVQGGMAILTITVAMLLQFVCQPYCQWDRRVSALDCMCCLSILMHCTAVLYTTTRSL
jgi:hypothetical protein